MRASSRVLAATFAVLSAVGVAGCGGGGQKSADVPNAVATAGAAAGHMLGGHAVAGAAIGALVQHERNKHGK